MEPGISTSVNPPLSVDVIMLYPGMCIVANALRNIEQSWVLSMFPSFFLSWVFPWVLGWTLC